MYLELGLKKTMDRGAITGIQEVLLKHNDAFKIKKFTTPTFQDLGFQVHSCADAQRDANSLLRIC